MAYSTTERHPRSRCAGHAPPSAIQPERGALGTPLAGSVTPHDTLDGASHGGVNMSKRARKRRDRKKNGANHGKKPNA
ncbi:hypothetical protein FCN18_35430 [Prauserella endophytica]|uniref:Uncharacterized protein n=1 Tax=Prauserella endophytica TaxID=1592324 RepID=A0ABY2RVH8_9PSEU|nr:hypothetical protein FCN18_35430 [Prauserella endophytica]